MKINKLIKQFSLLAISYFCLTATHVAAENFVEVKNESKKYAVAAISLGVDNLAFSECLRKNESTKFNLDEVGVPFGETYSVVFQLSYDCDALKKKTTLDFLCTKRKHGEVVTKDKFPVQPKRTTSTGTRNYVIRDKEKVRCAQK
ncbi:hypothetical protein OAP36_05450 [Planktomarina temperata]|nr:hypothetical protein [Planktomarina temperata]